MTHERIASPSLVDDNDEPDRAGRKRRRTVQACEECRDRKRKCDGVRPVCSSCSRRPGRCVWNDHRNTKGWSNKYVESLQARIRELEDRERAATSANAGRPSVAEQWEQPASDIPLETEGTTGIANVTQDANQTSSTAIHTGLSPLERNASIASPAPVGVLPVASLLSPSPSQTSFVHNLGVAPTQQPTLPTFHHPSAGSQHIEDAEPDSDTDASDDDGTTAVGSSRFVDGLDAMGVVHSAADGVTGRRRRPSEYFGPSSTVSLLGDAFNAINAMRKKAPWTGSSPSGSWEFAVGDRDSPGQAGKQHTTSPSRARDETNRGHAIPSSWRYTVPTRAEADQLVDSYRTWVHSLYPFVHMPSFLERYRTMWESTKERQPGSPTSSLSISYYEGMSEKLFHCMLNLVFAMGALFNPSVAFQDRSSVSWAFFARGKALVDLDELACGSPALVQVLLLMGQYLQSTDAASSCWNIVGLAIRVCQGIGLHQEPECCRGDVCIGGHHSQLEREIRRRTWTCSIILDRVLSLTYGRPMMIHPTMTVNRLWLPKAIDDEYLTGSGKESGEQPADQITITGCYIEAIRLQDIIGQFLAPINHYTDTNKRHTPNMSGSSRSTALNWYEKGDLDLKTVLEVDKLLDTWRRNLPIHLQVETYKKGRAASLNQDHKRLLLLERQAYVLKSRYLHARLTLLRPALSILCRAPHDDTGHDSESSSMDREMVIKAANMCLATTEALVDLMASNSDPQAVRLPAPWYNVFYIHSCAIVLLLGYLCAPQYITSMNRNSLADAYNRCVEFLRAYRPISRSARRCSKVLAVIQQQVFAQLDGVAGQNGNDHNNNATDWLSEFLPVEPIDLQTMIPLSDQIQPLEMLAPGVATREAPYLSDMGWIGDANDMAWLSLVPSWNGPDQPLGM